MCMHTQTQLANELSWMNSSLVMDRIAHLAPHLTQQLSIVRLETSTLASAPSEAKANDDLCSRGLCLKFYPLMNAMRQPMVVVVRLACANTVTLFYVCSHPVYLMKKTVTCSAPSDVVC